MKRHNKLIWKMLIFLEILCATNSFLKEMQLIGHKSSVHIELFSILYVLTGFNCSFCSTILLLPVIEGRLRGFLMQHTTKDL